KLEGFDTDWSETTGRRQAVYTNLPPKDYRFRVIASNDNGVWNTTGESYAFSIAPAYYQTIWFGPACFSAFLILIWLIHRYRLKQISLQLSARYQERLLERSRIAREMHDTLLQNISGFALQLDGVMKAPGIPTEEKSRLIEIRRDAEQCLR